MTDQKLSGSKRIVFGIGRRVSFLGEKTGLDFLLYNPFVMLHFHHIGKLNAPRLADSILEEFPTANSFLDVGSGSGAFAAELARKGISVVTFERSLIGRLLAFSQGVTCYPFDLTRTPPSRGVGKISPVSIVTCFEVAEHLSPSVGDKLVRFISYFKKITVFTAATPGQGGTGHVNEQEKSYWIKRFYDNGMIYCPQKSDSLRAKFERNGTSDWLAKNLSVFQPSENE